MGTTAVPETGLTNRSGIHTLLRRLEFAYLMRFPLIAAAILVLGLPIGYLRAPAMFTGLFDAGGFWSLAFVVWMEFMLAWSIMVTTRLILTYGPDRFDSLRALGARKPGQLRWRRVVWFGVPALPALLCTWSGSQNIAAFGKLGASLLGLSGSLLVLFAAAFAHFRIERGAGITSQLVLPSFGLAKKPPTSPEWDKSRPWVWKGIEWAVRKLPDDMTGGILREDRSFDGTTKRFLRSGHEMAIITFLLLLLSYCLGFFYSPNLVGGVRQPAALFYLLFLVTMATWFFYMAAFILDRFRLPVLTTMLVLSLVTGFIRTDHLYDIVQAPKQKELPAAEVIRRWEAGPRQGAKRPIIVVATAGGGIQAAAWTAQVLTGLQSKCGSGDFASSVLLVSSVSGGSVGTMYFLAAYDNAGKYPSDAESLHRIRYNASRSSLSAVGWGLLYPDTLRTLPIIGWFVPQDRDRGWALENAWITGWREPPDLRDWRHDVSVGSRPAVIFNATAAESGQRFLIGSTDLSAPGGMQFAGAYDGWDLPVATAARLSATFPYVSPVARASAGVDEKSRVHVADGGYYDNSGILSAVSWLIDAENELHGRTVILITIDSGAGSPANGKPWSWQKQMVAPVTTMLSLRTSSQQYRGALERTLAQESLQHNGIEVISAPFTYTGDMPLSWHLNATQKQNIERAWNEPTADISNSTNKVLKALGCQAPTQTYK